MEGDPLAGPAVDDDPFAEPSDPPAIDPGDTPPFVDLSDQEEGGLPGENPSEQTVAEADVLADPEAETPEPEGDPLADPEVTEPVAPTPEPAVEPEPAPEPPAPDPEPEPPAPDPEPTPDEEAEAEKKKAEEEAAAKKAEADKKAKAKKDKAKSSKANGRQAKRGYVVIQCSDKDVPEKVVNEGEFRTEGEALETTFAGMSGVEKAKLVAVPSRYWRVRTLEADEQVVRKTKIS